MVFYVVRRCQVGFALLRDLGPTHATLLFAGVRRSDGIRWVQVAREREPYPR
jgi:hypothetical protein